MKSLKGNSQINNLPAIKVENNRIVSNIYNGIYSYKYYINGRCMEIAIKTLTLFLYIYINKDWTNCLDISNLNAAN